MFHNKTPSLCTIIIIAYHPQLCDRLNSQLQVQEIEEEQTKCPDWQQARFGAIFVHLKFGLEDCSFLKKIIFGIMNQFNKPAKVMIYTYDISIYDSRLYLLWIANRAGCKSLGRIGSGRSRKNSLSKVATSWTPVSTVSVISPPRLNSSRNYQIQHKQASINWNLSWQNKKQRTWFETKERKSVA